jgi:hypothetical protein
MQVATREANFLAALAQGKLFGFLMEQIGLWILSQ